MAKDKNNGMSATIKERSTYKETACNSTLTINYLASDLKERICIDDFSLENC